MDIKQKPNGTYEAQAKGDPFWFTPFLDVLSALGSLATVLAFIIELRRIYRNREESKRLRELENKYDDLRFQFLKYQDNTRRLFHLLANNDRNFKEATFNMQSMNTQMDIPTYRLYSDIKSALRDTKATSEDILTALEILAIENGVDVSDSEVWASLTSHVSAILESWGKAGTTDVLAHLKDFNIEFQRVLHDSQEHNNRD